MSGQYVSFGDIPDEVVKLGALAVDLRAGMRKHRLVEVACMGDVVSVRRELDSARRTIKVLEQARPHWAQGHTDDGRAAQASYAALSAMWELLGVNNQTDAMAKLRKLVQP